MLAFDCLAELPFARLRLEQRPRKFVFVRLVNISINILMNLFWLLFCPWAAGHGQTWVHAVWSPEMGAGYVFLSNLIASAATVLLLAKEFAKVRWHFDRDLWVRMVSYSAPLIIVALAGIVDEMFSRSMLKYLLPGTTEQNLGQVGIFGANYKLAALITLFTQAYRYAAEPFFFRHASDSNAMQTQAEVTKWFTIAGTVGMLGILLFLDLVKYFIAVKYHSGLHVIPVLLMANLLLGVYYNFSVWYRLKDRTGLGAMISVGGAVLTILLNLALIPRYGYTGAAWVTLCCYTFMSWATWFTGRQHYPVPYQLGRMAWYAGSALGLAGVERLISPWLDPWMRWLLRLLLFGAYLAMIWYQEVRKQKPPAPAV